MAVEPNYCFTNTYEDVLSSLLESAGNGSIIFNLSLLKDKVQQVESIATTFISESQAQPRAFESTSINMDNIGGLLQEIIVVASNMMFTCQNMSLGANQTNPSNAHDNKLLEKLEFEQLSQPNMIFDWVGSRVENGLDNLTCDTRKENNFQEKLKKVDIDKHKETMSEKTPSPTKYDIIEIDAADLLAKYTHYCQVCGKGFKRDANLRMHMRAHGDEYKSAAALANPNAISGCTSTKLAMKYSCPQEGCRWNRKHVKFQPLKSMICIKNHYKRSHCPKMYACKRCNQKQFSVLSDLRTHEKHCGDVKWRCSCGTTFSRKDKLMGHVSLFIGHTPVFCTSSSIEG